MINTSNEVCSNCDNNHYILISCCGGSECGCMGYPTGIRNCMICNSNGTYPPSEYILQYSHLENMNDKGVRVWES